MKQAKVLNEAEMKRLLAVIETTRYNRRNRLAVMLSHLAGLRVGEIAAPKVGDVFDSEGKARDQIILKASYTKGNEARTVFVGSKLAKELARYRPASAVIDTGKIILRDYINATIGFDSLSQAVGTPPKSLMRMFSQRGNPNARNLLTIIGHLQKASGIELTVETRH